MTSRLVAVSRDTPKDAHKTKLERWKQVMSVESGSVPELPYLAWVPYEVTSCMIFRGGVVDVRKRGSFWVVGDVKT